MILTLTLQFNNGDLPADLRNKVLFTYITSLLRWFQKKICLKKYLLTFSHCNRLRYGILLYLTINSSGVFALEQTRLRYFNIIYLILDPYTSLFDICVPFSLHSNAFIKLIVTFEGAGSCGAVEPVPGGERDHPTWPEGWQGSGQVPGEESYLYQPAGLLHLQ